MADNSTQGGADSIRDIDRSGTGPKTQVFQLDHGGAGASESLTSPTNPLPAYKPNRSATGSLTALNSAVSLVLSGDGDVSMDIVVTALVGTIIFEQRLPTGVWYPTNATLSSTSGPVTTYVNPASGLYRLSSGGTGEVRVRVSAFGSGSATVLIGSSASSNAIYANQILPTKLFDGTNSAILKAASSAAAAADASLVVALSPNSPMPVAPAAATYSASIVGLAPAALATDIFTITGSATKTIRISRILVNGVQTTAGQVSVMAVKRSTANTVGTSTAPAKVPYDSASAAATATVLAYTANPTLGTTVGTITSSRLFVPGTASASDAQGLQVLTGDVGQQFITVRGIAEVVAINLNGVTVAGGALNITVEWTES